MDRASVDAQRNRLPVPARTEQQLDGKRFVVYHFCLACRERLSCFLRFARHEWLAVFVNNVDEQDTSTSFPRPKPQIRVNLPFANVVIACRNRPTSG